MGLFGGVLLLTIGSAAFADEALISVIISRSGNVSYLNMSPLHYEAKRKGMSPIQVSQGDFSEKPTEFRPMKLIIYSTCAQKSSALDIRPQFLYASLLLSPHPDDVPAAHIFSPIGLFRILKQVVRGHPYVNEKGTIKLSGRQNESWHVDIYREDTTYVSPKEDYHIEFSHITDQPLFIQALKSAAKPTGKNKIPKVTVLLESPSLYVKATYALIHKGAKNYQEVETMNIIEWWNKQQTWCPRKK